MKQRQFLIKVTDNTTASDEEIAALIQKLISVGLADAAGTLEDGEGGDLDSAQLAVGINIYPPEVATKPRVLVSVKGGIAGHAADEGVEVEIFDHDNYRADPEYTDRAPAHFADLAKQLDVPVEVSAS